MTSPARSIFRGSTLIELLCVLGIIALLGAILFTAFSSSGRRSHETVCLSNLRQMGVAIRMYQSDHDDDMPHELGDLRPQYVTNPHVFRCPAWIAAYESEGGKTQTICESMLTMYAFEPAERRFWANVPPEDGDPKELSETWETRYNRTGEHSPLIKCQFHDPHILNHRNRAQPPPDLRRIRLVLYTDGSVGKRESRWEKGKTVYIDL